MTRPRCIGVLTGASETDDGRLVSPAGQNAHIELAAAVQRILIDILGHEGD